MAKTKRVPTADDSALVDREKEYERLVREVGMSPYNAALTAGFTPTLALERQAVDLAAQIFGGMKFSDIAERKLITPMKIIEHLAMRAGFFDREKGARKIVSLTPTVRKMINAATSRMAKPDDQDLPDAHALEWDWVEVPDDQTQAKYMAMLLDFLEYSGQAKPGAVIPVGSGNRSFSIHFHVQPEAAAHAGGKVIEMASKQVATNGNGTHFTVVE